MKRMDLLADTRGEQDDTAPINVTVKEENLWLVVQYLKPHL